MDKRIRKIYRRMEEGDTFRLLFWNAMRYSFPPTFSWMADRIAIMTSTTNATAAA